MGFVGCEAGAAGVLGLKKVPGVNRRSQLVGLTAHCFALFPSAGEGSPTFLSIAVQWLMCVSKGRELEEGISHIMHACQRC